MVHVATFNQCAAAEDSLTRIIDRMLDISNRGNLIEQMSIGSREAVELHRACVLDNKHQACSEVINRSTEYGFASRRTVGLAYLTRGQHYESVGDFANALLDFENGKILYPTTPNIDAEIERVTAELRSQANDENLVQSTIRRANNTQGFDQIARGALFCDPSPAELPPVQDQALSSTDDAEPLISANCLVVQSIKNAFGLASE